MYKIVPTYASAGTKETKVGIKLTDEQIEKAEAAGFLAWQRAGEPGESYLWERRYVADAATAHVVREIGKKMWREGSVMCISEKDWQAIIAEAGLVELTGIRIEIDTNLKSGDIEEAK